MREQWYSNLHGSCGQKLHPLRPLLTYHLGYIDGGRFFKKETHTTYTETYQPVWWHRITNCSENGLPIKPRSEVRRPCQGGFLAKVLNAIRHGRYKFRWAMFDLTVLAWTRAASSPKSNVFTDYFQPRHWYLSSNLYVSDTRDYRLIARAHLEIGSAVKAPGRPDNRWPDDI